MSSRMSTSPDVGHGVPVRRGEPSIQNAGQYPAPLLVLTLGCWIDACIITTPPAGAPKFDAWVSTRPDVQPEPGLVPECRARRTRCPAPSWNTLAVLLVIVSISPVPKPVPVSYFHVPVFNPVPAAPLKSSLQVRLNPAGGAGTAAGATPAAWAAGSVVAAEAIVVRLTVPAASASAQAPTISRFRFTYGSPSSQGRRRCHRQRRGGGGWGGTVRRTRVGGAGR